MVKVQGEQGQERRTISLSARGRCENDLRAVGERPDNAATWEDLVDQRQAIVQDWRKRLVADEAQAESSPLRFSWLFRARARIYRVLLAMYGSGMWRSDKGGAAAEVLAAHPNSGRAKPVTVFDSGSPLVGKRPKSLAAIRTTLKGLSTLIDAPDAAASRALVPFRIKPKRGWTIVLTSRSKVDLRQASLKLRLSHMRYRVDGIYLLVRETDRTRAIALLQEEDKEQWRQRKLRSKSAQAAFVATLVWFFAAFTGIAAVPALGTPLAGIFPIFPTTVFLALWFGIATALFCYVFVKLGDPNR